MAHRFSNQVVLVRLRRQRPWQSRIRPRRQLPATPRAHKIRLCRPSPPPLYCGSGQTSISVRVARLDGKRRQCLNSLVRGASAP